MMQAVYIRSQSLLLKQYTFLQLKFFGIKAFRLDGAAVRGRDKILISPRKIFEGRVVDAINAVCQVESAMNGSIAGKIVDYFQQRIRRGCDSLTASRQSIRPSTKMDIFVWLCGI